MRSLKVAAHFCIYSYLSLEFSFAEDQENLEEQNIAKINISITIPEIISIDNFSDLTLDINAITNEININDNLSIEMNHRANSRKYRVTANGSGPRGTFIMKNGSEHLKYNTYFNDRYGINGRMKLESGIALTSQGGATNLNENKLNANISVYIPEGNIKSKNESKYTGVLTLVFAPE